MAVPTTLMLTKGNISMIIYLYKKTHNKTGLQYLGKTTRDPYTYEGSGEYWIPHIKKHGYDVTTEILHECKTNDEVKKWGLYYSELWNIVDSKDWANLRPETGDGGDTSKFINYDNVHKNIRGKTYEEIYGNDRAAELKRSRALSNTRTKRGKPLTEEQKAKRRHSYGPRSQEFKNKLSEIAKNRPKPIGQCPHCHKTGVERNLKRWHFDRCKNRPL